MNLLAFNVVSSQQLRTGLQISLSVLPLGLMFGAFVPLFLLVPWLEAAFGIPHNAPVKDQPNGLLWLVVFLAIMVLLMLVGYLLGWVLNALVMRIVFRWPSEQVNRIFLYSEFPPSWIKGGTKPEVADSAWAETRRKGRSHFVLYRGVLAWGGPMYFVMALAPALNGRAEPSLFYFIWTACLWGAAGAAFGLVIWHFSEKQFLKHNGTNEP